MKPFNGMPVPTEIQLYKIPSTGPHPNYIYATPSLVINAQDALPLGVADRAKHFHPRKVLYRVPGPARALAHLIDNPELVATGFGALALYGLPFLTDSADTILTGPSVPRKQLATSLTPGVIRSDPFDVWHLQFHQRTIRAVSPSVALAQALSLVRKGEEAWEVISVPSLDVEFVRAVQLIDAARHFLHIDAVELLAASRQRVNLTWLTSALIASSALSESPKETEMRLLAQVVASNFHLTLVEQFVLRDASGNPITRFDLAFVELKIGLMYDGAQHWEHERRHKDTKINLEAAALEWQVLRFSARTLRLLISTLEAILSSRGGAG